MRKGKKINLGRTAEGFLISLGISFLLIILFSLISALTLGMLDNPTRHIGTFARCLKRRVKVCWFRNWTQTASASAYHNCL